MWGNNLDRFSQALTTEGKRTFSDGPYTYEIEEVVVCKGCNQIILEDEEKLQSEFWEDDYMHFDQDCIETYYRNVKDPFAANKEVG